MTIVRGSQIDTSNPAFQASHEGVSNLNLKDLKTSLTSDDVQ